MSTQILLPKIGFSMNDGILAEWLAPDGGAVSQGQPLYTLESEKTVQEIESPVSGKLKIIAPPGKLYTVGTLLGEIS